MIYLNHVRFVAAFSVVIVASAFMVTPVVAALQLQNVTTWYWAGDTRIYSVAVGDVDGDGSWEIVAGGFHHDGTRNNAQLCVWSGSALALENVKTWFWTADTFINSVAIGDVDGDGDIEIVTGGYHWDGVRYVAQLCVWGGSDLALEGVTTWFWTASTFVSSVTVADVDGDGSVEIVTGGYYGPIAQLCVWNGSTLALENVKTWYWTRDTFIYSVAVGDVDGDGSAEIVTGGHHDDGERYNAQLCVWTGSNLALESVKTWYWAGNTEVYSVALGDVDVDGDIEIVTGGHYWDGARYHAELFVWSGSDLAIEDFKTWYWTGSTGIFSVAVGDVDADESIEIVTGGCHWDGAHYNAQLCAWSGSTLSLEDVTTWYWTADTFIYSVAVGDIDSDSSVEMVTGGSHFATRHSAQLAVWVKT